MRLNSVLVGIFGLGLLAAPASAPASAYENFIPLGAGYSTSLSALPGIDSERQRIIQQTDIYETELYRKQLQQRIQDSRNSAFFNDPMAYSSDRSIDY